MSIEDSVYPPTPWMITKFKDYHTINLAWGNLHICMDDGNMEDSNVLFCMKEALRDHDWDGVVLATYLFFLTFDQRLYFYDMFPSIPTRMPLGATQKPVQAFSYMVLGHPSSPTANPL